MESYRTDDRTAESGIALVNAMIIMAMSLMFIAGLNYFLIGSWKVAIISKKYSTVQEAAAGGAGHAAEGIRLINIGSSTNNLGIDSNGQDVVYLCDKTKRSHIKAKTADKRYDIGVTVRCIEQKPIPGGNALVFPPPPSTTGVPSHFIFYSVVSEAKDSVDQTIGRIEAVYRYAR